MGVSSLKLANCYLWVTLEDGSLALTRMYLFINIFCLFSFFVLSSMWPFRVRMADFDVRMQIQHKNKVINKDYSKFIMAAKDKDNDSMAECFKLLADTIREAKCRTSTLLKKNDYLVSNVSHLSIVKGGNETSQARIHFLQSYMWKNARVKDNYSYYRLDAAVEWITFRLFAEFSDQNFKGEMIRVQQYVVAAREARKEQSEAFLKCIRNLESYFKDWEYNLPEIRMEIMNYQNIRYGGYLKSKIELALDAALDLRNILTVSYI